MVRRRPGRRPRARRGPWCRRCPPATCCGRSSRRTTRRSRRGVASAGSARTRRLPPCHPGYEATRIALHAVAEHVLKPAREKANGKIGLRYVRGGFGTPFFGDDAQVSVRGRGAARRARWRGDEHPADLARRRSRGARRPRRRRAARRGLPADPLSRSTRPPRAFIGDWFGFAYSVLEELRARATAEQAPSRVQIWPEHFDAALELGAEAAGRPRRLRLLARRRAPPRALPLRRARGPPARPASSGTRTASPAPSCPTPTCSPPTTRARSRSSSSRRGPPRSADPAGATSARPRP